MTAHSDSGCFPSGRILLAGCRQGASMVSHLLSGASIAGRRKCKSDPAPARQNRRAGSACRFILSCLFSAITIGALPAVAQTAAPGYMPLPPVRPHKGQPSTQGNRAPAPGSIPEKSARPPATMRPVAVHPIEAPGPLSKRRAIIRECAMKWRGLQMAKMTGDMLWRDFSRACMIAKEPPSRP